ncbi:MAG TPA: hypothetical protein PKC24_05625 [Cyclobacteriaceae bacterium]|nr:hypothetical protein [Cyclobacteriaceae bacterium]
MRIDNKVLAIGFLLMLACSSPAYLPTSNNIGVNEYGSHIKINQKSGERISGELIAINENEIIVLTGSVERVCKQLDVSSVDRFKILYARPKNYGWTIPLFTIFTITHGWFLALTAPVNLIATSTVTTSGQNAFTYNHKNMTLDKVRMFARFPQGLPEGVDMASIR